jgi:hypothetical protein
MVHTERDSKAKTDGSMMASPVHLQNARDRVAKMRSVLLTPTPEAIEECLPGLAEAADLLGRVQQDLAAGGRRDILVELHALRRELGALAKLIGHGAEFYRGWANLLGAATAGYTPTGEAAPVAPSGRISIQG